MATGSLKSRDIIEACLGQIDRHNYKGLGLRAVVDTAPHEIAFKVVEALDDERASKGPRGPLHGIPILVKLIEADLIIIDKASLSELCLLEATPPNTGGWYSVSGQTQSPYARGGGTSDAKYLGHSTPCGSSSGSAIGVAAGFAPISIGTQMDEHSSQAYLEFHAFEAKPDPDFPKKHEFVRTHAKEAIDKLFLENNLDMLMGNGDGRMTAIASAAGYVVGSASLGYADNFNGRAFGINLITGSGGERKMLEVMSTWE
ncbi:hypothetical protein IL306_006497 [Fusarium sp. DS 682]|nr:hypothetical protein IL306_006497 [Fusarium sp. DS 682]